MIEYSNLLLEVDEESGVALLTINRADKLNALNKTLLDELALALDEVAGNERVRAMVITGAGSKAFVAGADIAEIAALDDEELGEEFARSGQSVFSKIERLTIPVIMAINGYALGGGCELALCGDIRIASDNAQLGQPEVNLGVIPGYGGTQRLARIIGRDRAKSIIFTGERVGAEDAYRLGTRGPYSAPGRACGRSGQSGEKPGAEGPTRTGPRQNGNQRGYISTPGRGVGA